MQVLRKSLFDFISVCVASNNIKAVLILFTNMNRNYPTKIV